ncbi:MAG TPA: cytochrome c oxidase subunit II [Thermoplasmata archaeon]|nr:cytochrome c oxidase subunit II [Thermoplasmata archaeon]
MDSTRKLEYAWTLAVVALLAGVLFYSTLLLYKVDATPTHVDEYVSVKAHQWFWEFCYSNGTCASATYNPSTNTATGGALWVRPGTVVQINVTSSDVIHSFNVPSLGVRIDAIPGRVNTFAFGIPNAAIGTTYLIQCTEFCGTYHGIMRAFVVVT